jgi:S-DNA-T family DNA segregation ATPase FtsK/SpoIIIE
MALVDPKMVEMAMYRDIPHLMCPVITEMNQAAALLEWATQKMDERYELLAEAGVRDIDSYNKLGWMELRDRFMPATPEEEAVIPKKLPYMVFVIEELADLMMTNKEVEGHIVRVAQKARAVGMHLILATQRPQANVVTGLIKGNMPCRCSFKVASRVDSRIVLDQPGAELLLGHGDMLFLSPRSSKLIRAQGTFVEDTEIRRAVKHLKTLAEPDYEPSLVPQNKPHSDPADRDPLFDSAVEVVLQSQRGSVSLLQRRLAVGYSRASRLIEQMEEAGILGEHKGSVAREVNITLEEWEELRAARAAQEEAANSASNSAIAAAAAAQGMSVEASYSPEAAAPTPPEVAEAHAPAQPPTQAQSADDINGPQSASADSIEDEFDDADDELEEDLDEVCEEGFEDDAEDDTEVDPDDDSVDEREEHAAGEDFSPQPQAAEAEAAQWEDLDAAQVDPPPRSDEVQGNTSQEAEVLEQNPQLDQVRPESVFFDDESVIRLEEDPSAHPYAYSDMINEELEALRQPYGEPWPDPDQEPPLGSSPQSPQGSPDRSA